jgi:UDP-N-acetylmuramoyl-tripeptide--D-alanyl-D-alanine ligase
MRLEVRRLPDEVTLVNDAYNANPKSMEAALAVLTTFDCRGRRIFVCGEMLELGRFSEELHRQLGARVAASRVDLLFALGSKGLEVVEGALQAGFPAVLAFRADSPEELAETLKDTLKPGDVALFKASRGVKLERVVQKLEEAFPTDKPGLNSEPELTAAAMHRH